MSIYVYKLTDKYHMTRGQTQWGENVTHQVKWSGFLCSDGCLHAYRSPELAVLMNPIHGHIQNPVLWRARTPKILADDGTKIGMSELTTIERIPLPMPTEEQRVEFAIKVALLQYSESSYVLWAKNWLSNKDRSTLSACAIAKFTHNAAEAATRYTDANAAYSAAYAAEAVTHINDGNYAATYGIHAKYINSYSARAADAAARAAATAARAVVNDFTHHSPPLLHRMREASDFGLPESRQICLVQR